MITLNLKDVKSIIINNYNNFCDKISIVKNSVEKIEEFSKFLTITSISKIDEGNSKSNKLFLFMILVYEIIFTLNCYSSYKCPQCKQKNCMHFHKLYKRNVIFKFNGYLIEAKFSIIVLECSFCKGSKKHKQHYHSLFPHIIFPYHIYSSEIIIDTLVDKIINEVKINKIMESKRISHQLLYKWLNELSIYKVTSSIILSISGNLKDILSLINKDRFNFYQMFFDKYDHPFFLFKETCVPLAIMP